MRTPLIVGAWSELLRDHTDRAFVRYIINGLTDGFRIGFSRKSPLTSARSNMPSAALHPQVISDYLAKELALDRMLGPFPLTGWSGELHINRFGVIPKGHNTGKWRLITDLSFPPARSVNDGIEPLLCSLSYITVDQVARIVQDMGRGALLAKIDIESAYRLIPVHPDDRTLQAMQWENEIYVDPMLPFGLRSAPKIFNAVADAFQWILQQQGVTHILHYLDDYITIGPPRTPVCQHNPETLLTMAAKLGVPIVTQRTEGPVTALTFLGIKIDTVSGQLLLPADKLQRLKELLGEWGDRKVCLQKELQSLIGLLNHACKVVRAGRSFLRRMIDLLHERSNELTSTPIRLNRSFRSDLAWWACFVERWNGISFLHPVETLPIRRVASDASGHWGCGAWSGDEWFQWQWSATTGPLQIAVKEMIPVVLGCAIWGHAWAGCRIIWRCDNQAVVACLGSRTSRDPTLMHLIRNIVFLEAYGGFHIQAEYIDTHANHVADDLSRNRLSSFFLKVPNASRLPSLPPAAIAGLLLDVEVDWVSPHWRHQFKTTLDWVWQTAQGNPTRQPPNASTISAPSSRSTHRSQCQNNYCAASQHF